MRISLYFSLQTVNSETCSQQTACTASTCFNSAAYAPFWRSPNVTPHIRALMASALFQSRRFSMPETIRETSASPGRANAPARPNHNARIDYLHAAPSKVELLYACFSENRTFNAHIRIHAFGHTRTVVNHPNVTRTARPRADRSWSRAAPAHIPRTSQPR